MEREKLPGTIKAVARRRRGAVGAKAYFVRAGLFKDVDISLFAHVGTNFGVSWGDGIGTGLCRSSTRSRARARTRRHSRGAGGPRSTPSS